jgi:hypothetical protein
MDWCEVCDIVRRKEFHLLGRLQPDIDVYYQWLQEIKDTYVTVEDYLLCIVMGYQKEAVDVPLAMAAAGLTASVTTTPLTTTPSSSSSPVSSHSMVSSGQCTSKTKYRAVPPQPSSPTSNPKQAVFRRNDFPYALTPDIQHDVVWSFQPLEEAELVRFIASNIADREFVYFVNPPQLQSVKNLWHAHVFSRQR